MRSNQLCDNQLVRENALDSRRIGWISELRSYYCEMPLGSKPIPIVPESAVIAACSADVNLNMNPDKHTNMGAARLRYP